MLVSTAGAIEILWTLWTQHGRSTRVGERRFKPWGAISSAASRTHLPPLRGCVPSTYSFLRPVRKQHDLNRRVPDNETLYAYNSCDISGTYIRGS